ncbi:hypothetical protein [Acidovorax sp. SDU_ACID1]|uniref:hypothetical protein n=1 Tax=Acidovorax sp. SDU_ACID1 TaxID=3136632 RepID=UPI0038738A0E
MAQTLPGKLPLAVQDVLINRKTDLRNLAEALAFLPEGIAVMLNTPGHTGMLAGLLHPMTAYLQQIASDLESLSEGRVPSLYP